MASVGTSSPSAADTFLCFTRAPVRESSWLKCTVLRDTAAYSLIGMLTSPKLIEPLQMARGMGKSFPDDGFSTTPDRYVTTVMSPEASHSLACGELLRAMT